MALLLPPFPARSAVQPSPSCVALLRPVGGAVRFAGRWVRRRGGRAGFALVLLSAVLACGQPTLVTLSSDGAWTWYNDPRAVFHNGILYFGCVRTADGRTVLNAFDPQTGQSTHLWASALTQKDDHNNPGLLVKEDGTLLALHARHGSDQFFSYRLSTGTNPVSPADWTAEQTIPPTGKGLTYANPFQLSAEAGRIYNFSRNLNFNPTVFTSGDGGVTWSAPQLFIRNGSGGIRPYVKYAADDAQRIDFLYTDGHPRDITNSLYHLYYQRGAFHQTDGTLVRTFANLPILHDAGERGAVVYQYSEAPGNDPDDHIPAGRAWCWEMVCQTNDQPVCLFTVQRDQVTGVNWSDDRIYYYYARWTGTNWQKRFIAHAGRPLYSAEDDYAGGICADPASPDVIYLSSNAQDPFNLTDTTNVPLRAGERYEIYRGVTTNGGLNFTWEAVTTNSAKDNLRPYVPRRQSGTPVVIWFRGTYSTYTAYNCEIVGLFPHPVAQPPAVSLHSPRGSPVAFTNLLNQLWLEAAVTNAGPNPPKLAWTTVSGPAQATFESPAAAATPAAFPLPGAYVVRVTAQDGVLTASADLTVFAGNTSTDAPDDSRALWLKLDETTGGTAADSSGNGLGGALAGGTTWQPAAGIRAGAVKFDGVSGVITVPDAPLLDNTPAFTLAYWFRAEAHPPDSAGLVSKRDSASANNAYTTYLKGTDQRIYVDIAGSDNRFASATLIQTGRWYHVALVFDGALPAASRASLWINGRLDVTANESAAAVPDYSSHVRLGNTPASVPAWFNGWLDDVRFYRRALSGEEIIALALTNTAPSVTIQWAGPVTNSVPVAVGGAVADDGPVGSLAVTWRQAGGEGGAVFASSNSLTTTVTFDGAGNHLLRLTAEDAQAAVCADQLVTVQPNPNLYDDWIALSLPGVTNPALLHLTADPEGDGAPNLLEFALGMNPSLADAVAFGADHPGLPAGRILNLDGTNYLSLRVRRPMGRLGISYATEAGGDLRHWQPGVPVGLPETNGDGSETLTFRDPEPVAESRARFMRLKISRP